MASVKILEKQPVYLKNVKAINQPKIKIKDKSPKVEVKSNLPFRIKITNVLIPGSQNPPGIGARIIGVNNYIL